MSSADKNLSLHSDRQLGDFSGKRIGIVISEWNEEITQKLGDGARAALLKYGVKEEDIITAYVPGSFELILGSQWMADDASIDAVIALGCIIQGETRHFEFISQTVANGIKDVGIKSGKPVVFGVLTTDDQQQAFERAGGKHGDKGYEAGITALKMLGLRKELK
jgi:6,7-dimethyl-8-ribityllumazine synthase